MNLLTLITSIAFFFFFFTNVVALSDLVACSPVNHIKIAKKTQYTAQGRIY